jgi:hypothetical protein
MSKTQERVQKVLSKMSQLLKEDDSFADLFSGPLERCLTELKDEDHFGSEGQCDPRGDGRDGEFSMTHVQGVDD